MKTVILLASALLLSGCASSIDVNTLETERPKLELEQPAPLNMRPVEWKVLKIEDIPYFALDTKNFENLTKNTEDIQNHLYLQKNIIDLQTQYYEKTVDK